MARKNFTDVFDGDFGNVLEKNYDGSENDSSKNKIYNSLKVNVTSSEQAKLAEEELTGKGIVSNLMYQGFNRSNVLGKSTEALLDKRDNLKDHGVYINFIGSETNADENEDSSGYKDKEIGMIIGGMKKVSNNTSAGGFLGYLSSDIDYKDNGKSNQKSDTLSISGALVTDVTEKLKWTNTINYNYGMTDMTRKITYDRSNRELNGDFNSWSAGGKTKIEYTQNIGKNIELIPSFGVSVDYLRQNSYTETGDNTYALNVDGASGTSVRAEVGLRPDITVYNSTNTNFKVIPSVRYSYELADPYKDRDVTMSAFDDGISVISREAGKDVLDLGIHLVYNYKENISVFGGYNAGFSDDTRDESFNFGIKYQW